MTDREAVANEAYLITKLAAEGTDTQMVVARARVLLASAQAWALQERRRRQLRSAKQRTRAA